MYFVRAELKLLSRVKTQQLLYCTGCLHFFIGAFSEVFLLLGPCPSLHDFALGDFALAAPASFSQGYVIEVVTYKSCCKCVPSRGVSLQWLHTSRLGLWRVSTRAFLWNMVISFPFGHLKLNNLIHRCYVDSDTTCIDARKSLRKAPFQYSCEACDNRGGVRTYPYLSLSFF